ncbi:ATP-dependent DNA helicase RecG [Candidatus Falkowbacteria bacterium]|nr:ATP-dependent DNA helicase RecG [Candidatus Falkowbacteria bacterium]
MLTLDTGISSISRVGDSTAKKLRSLGIETVEELLFYFPFRYDDFSKPVKTNQIVSGENACLVGRIELLQNKKSFRKKVNVTEALVSDENGSVKVVWFNQPFIVKNLKVGDLVSLAGKVEEDFAGPFLASPNYEKIMPGVAAVNTQGLVANYNLTAGLTQKQLRYLIRQVLPLAKQVKDWLPEEIIKKNKFLPLASAIELIHFPKNPNDIFHARRRLAFNELFAIQLAAQQNQLGLSRSKAPQIHFDQEQTKKFVDDLPFTLTNAQRKAAWAVLQDLEKDKPMTRLIEGDVGSGKTVVAALVMLNAAASGWQSALLVPTEILAKQHFFSLSKLLKNTDVRIGLVTRSEARSNQDELAFTGEAIGKKLKKPDPQTIINNSDIIIGTHAIIQQKIQFDKLGFVVIDEQHRFGVAQRQTLLDKMTPGADSTPIVPHLLSMTATPIPRSLALALYGDLSISILDELPAGRKQITTRIVSEDKRQLAYKFIKEQIEQGRQAFVICPLIDPSDKLGVKSVTTEFEKLDQEIFPDLAVGLLHGKMKAKEKEQVMSDFAENKTKILVSTSVVEVGVDVPNATIMMIEGAERFGLAQLHQFRGRVGRSVHQSYCFLFSESGSGETQRRLNALVENHDGFSLAKIDLELRGPGEVYGQLQKGFPELKIASLFDYALMDEAKQAVALILSADPQLKSHPLLMQKMADWQSNIHWE